MNKKGELTSSQIITIILAIIGFIIVLIVLFTIMDTESQTQKDLCHLSVIARGTSPETTQKYIPLECTTEKICLTTGKDCNELIGEKNIQTIKLPTGTRESDIKEAARIIEKTTSEAMYDCWNMMGQGKIDIFSKGAVNYLGFEETELMCVICSRIALNIPDQETKDKILNEVDIKNYMATTKIPQKEISYLNAFTDKGTSTYSKISDEALQTIESLQQKDFKTSKDEISIVFSQIKPEEYGETFKNLVVTGATIAGATFFTPGIGKLAVVGGEFLGAKILIPVVGGVVVYSMSNVHAGRVASAGYCGNFISQEEKAVKGCTTIQTVPYEFTTINEICAGGIDGNP